jgi:serine/threonine protein kinase
MASLILLLAAAAVAVVRGGGVGGESPSPSPFLLCAGMRYVPAVPTRFRPSLGSPLMPVSSSSAAVIIVDSPHFDGGSVAVPVLPSSSVHLPPTQRRGDLGAGAHGELTSATHDGHGRVALKFLDREARPRAHCALLREAAAHVYISRRLPKFVVPIYGVVDAREVGLRIPLGVYTDAERRGTAPPSPRFAVVMRRMHCAAPLCPSLLLPSPNATTSGSERGLADPASLKNRLIILLQGAEALRALHEVVGAVHGDVKGLNLLVDVDEEEVVGGLASPSFAPPHSARHSSPGSVGGAPESLPRARLSDFGRFTRRSFGPKSNVSCGYAAVGGVEQEEGRGATASRHPSASSRHPSALVSRLEAGDGAVYSDGFGAPETLYCPALNSPSAASASSDVFAFGVTMWEMLVRVRPLDGPFAFLPTQRLVDSAILSGVRPPTGRESLLPCVPLDVLALMRECWRGERERRPGMGEVAARLRRAVGGGGGWGACGG